MNNQPHPTDHAKATDRCRPTTNVASAILWASAFVIAAMIITQAGRLPQNAAHADVAAERGQYTLLTAASGRGGGEQPYELLYVLDSRDQMFLVYEIENVQQFRIHRRDGGSLDMLFRNARR